MMREIEAKKITETVSRLLQEACYHLSADAVAALKAAADDTAKATAQTALDAANAAVPAAQAVSAPAAR